MLTLTGSLCPPNLHPELDTFRSIWRKKYRSRSIPIDYMISESLFIIRKCTLYLIIDCTGQPEFLFTILEKYLSRFRSCSSNEIEVFMKGENGSRI